MHQKFIIYLYCLSVGLFVSNKRQNGKNDKANFFVVSHIISESIFWNIVNICSHIDYATWMQNTLYFFCSINYSIFYWQKCLCRNSGSFPLMPDNACRVWWQRAKLCKFANNYSLCCKFNHLFATNWIFMVHILTDAS